MSRSRRLQSTAPIAAGSRPRAETLRWRHERPEEDIDPSTELVEEDEDQALPEPEQEIDLTPQDLGGRSRRGIARVGPRRHRRSWQAGAGLARRLPHDRCQRRRALCRQGQEHPQTDRRLHPPDRLRPPHRAHDRGDRLARVRLDRDRDRSAPARSQSDQAAAPALQRAAARRQVVPLYPDHRRPLGAANPQAPRRAQARGQILRAVRLGLGGQPHHHGAAARLSAALLLRRLLREPHAAVPASSDQALLRSLHARDRFRRICGARARSQRIPVGQERGR